MDLNYESHKLRVIQRLYVGYFFKDKRTPIIASMVGKHSVRKNNLDQLMKPTAWLNDKVINITFQIFNKKASLWKKILSAWFDGMFAWI